MELKGYLATHFFDLFGFEGTAKLAEQIRKETPLKLYVPQENGDINDKENNDGIITDEAIYYADMRELLSSQILIAYLDGVEIDSGVSAEIGMFCGSLETLEALGFGHSPKLILGIYTDMRKDGTGDNRMYKNLFVKGGVKRWGKVVHTIDDLINEINNFCSSYPL